MQKNNTRNFICSFLFSVLAVFCIQKLFLRTPDIKQVAPKSDIKLEKISLFAEKNAVQPAPQDLTTTASNQIDVSAISELTADPIPEPQKVAMAETVEPTAEIKDAEPSENKNEKVYDTTDIAFASPITLDEQEIEEIKDLEGHIKSGVVYAQNQNDSNKSDVDLAYSDEQEIPIIEDSQTKHQYINVSNSSSASQIAMVEPDVLISSIEEPDILNEEKDLAEANIKNNELDDVLVLSSGEEAETPQDDVDESAWEVAEIGANSSSNTNEENSPWVMAKGNKYAKNQAVVEAFSQKQENNSEPEQSSEDPKTDNITADEQVISQTFSEPLLKEKEPSQNEKLAYQMIQNILIPIPEDILSDTDLTPDLTASPDGKKKETKTIVVTDETPQPEKELNEDEKQSGLFKSITTWFGKNKQSTQESANAQKTQKKSKTKKSEKTAKQKALFALGQEQEQQEQEELNEQQKDPTPIMPAELRLSFQPNRAEISGQTLKWIYAFADNARDNDDVYVEVRIDGTGSYALQQKRLNLLSSIFSARGVDYRKVNTVFTSREPNSFIIRNIRFNNKERERQQTIYTGELIECP